MNKIFNLDGELVNSDEKYALMDNPLDHWCGMPKFDACGVDCYARIEFKVKKTDQESIDNIAKWSEQSITDKTKSIWYPKLVIGDFYKTNVYDSAPENKQPIYPIYIVSKSRFENRITSNILIKNGVKHYMVVEQSQYDDYNSRVDHDFVTVLVLDQSYLDNYDTCDDLGNTRSKGPGAARNFAWDHSIKLGAKRHWVLDDNFENFYRYYEDKRIVTHTGAIFQAMESHADQYENVAISGPNYMAFAKPIDGMLPFVCNTRIYSCLLIKNDIDYRWRGRYNEDTDICLRVLKDGLCTIQYNAFLSGKITTQRVSGGNTEEFYEKEGTLPKSQMIADLHPDIAVVKWRFRRWHHEVDYSGFKKNRLIRIGDAPTEPNEFGMFIRNIDV